MMKEREIVLKGLSTSFTDFVSNVLKRGSIVFVHGLRGHPVNTWQSSRGLKRKAAVDQSSSRQGIKSFFSSKASASKNDNAQGDRNSIPQKVFWPQDYVAKDIPEARVWTYGYNADVIGGMFEANNKNSVSQHGRDLSVKLERDIENEDPIIFIAHSLGGIIIKDAICRSEIDRLRTRLIIFLGTPHRGSELASWGEIASNLCRLALQDSHKGIVSALSVDSEVLDNIHERFTETACSSNIRIHSFQESRGISGMKGLHEKVVDDFSSKLGLPRSFETVESIDANHMEIARCGHRSDENYRAIFGVLKQSLKNGLLGQDGDNKQQIAPLITGLQMISGQAISSAGKRKESIRAIGPFYNLPFLRNQDFTGRKSKLNELEEKLLVDDKCQKLALYGLGGIGKTQLALEFVYAVKQRQPERSIFWVPALSTESFEQAYKEIAISCSISVNSQEEDLKKSVQRYLSNDYAGKWLLVVDNSDEQEILFGTSHEPKGIVDYLPKSEHGLTLFTTRHRGVAISLAGNKVVELQEMNVEEAQAFLEKLLIREELLRDKITVTGLLTELTHLPLAIAQAAAYINKIDIPISEYMQLLHDTEEDIVSLLSREFRDGTRYTKSQNAIAATWLVSFNQIRRSDPDAADMLSFISCIENKAIPRSLLPSLQPKERMMHALGTLSAYSFIARRQDQDSYDAHRLVHIATRVWLERCDQRAEWKERVVARLVEVFPSGDYASRVTWREYLPHALRFLKETQKLDNVERSALCLAVGRCLQTDGRVKEAVIWLFESFLWRMEHFAEDHPDRLTSQSMLAYAYEADGQVKKAVELLEQVAAIRKKVLAEDHPSRLTSQSMLAYAYEADGQVKKAVELLEQVVAIQENVLAEDHPSRLTSQHGLARAYRADGQVKKAVELLEQVVAIQENVLAEDHPDRLTSQSMLAYAYEADGQVKKAVELLEQVVAIRENVLAEDHPDRLTSQHVLASAYRADGQVKKAVKLLEQVVAIRKKVLAEDHPDRLTSQHELASAYQADRQVKKAVKLLEQVVAIRKKVLAEDHPDRLVSERLLFTFYESS